MVNALGSTAAGPPERLIDGRLDRGCPELRLRGFEHRVIDVHQSLAHDISIYIVRIHIYPQKAARELDVYSARRSGRHASLTHSNVMTRIVVMGETLPLATVKAHLSEIVDRVEHEHDRVVLTRNGRPAAVIMSPADLEALEDTLELLSDSDALAEIESARDEVARGDVVTADELRAKFLQR